MVLTKVPGTSIADDAITSAKITDATIVSADIANTTITSGNMALDPRNADNISSGSVPLAQLGNAPAYDDSALLNDIATLALHSGIQNNQTAYNLTNAFIDQYEDDTGIDDETNVDRNADEYMSSVVATSAAYHINSGGFASKTAGAADPVFSLTNNARTSFGQNTGSSGLSLNNQVGINSGIFTFEMTLVAKANGAQPHCYGYGVMKNNAAMIAYTGNTYSAYPNGTHFNNSSNVGDKLKMVYDTDTPDAITTYYDSGSGYGSAETGKNSVGANFSDAITTLYFFLPCWSDSNLPWIWDTTGTRVSGTTNATGSYTSTTQTALSTVSKMSIVVLYKNAYGTATLDTDIVAEVSSNGGSNYVSAPLTAAGTFSTGILTAKSNDITISSTGTAPKYKISFANQVAESKETRVYGVALLY